MAKILRNMSFALFAISLLTNAYAIPSEIPKEVIDAFRTSEVIFSHIQVFQEDGKFTAVGIAYAEPFWAVVYLHRGVEGYFFGVEDFISVYRQENGKSVNVWDKESSP